MMKSFKRAVMPIMVFLLSLGILSSIFFIHRTYMSETDEIDHLTAAYLIDNGKSLYKDIFSHHFPFPYYWTYLFTPLWSLTNPSRTITIFRLSVLVFYAISFIAVFFSLKKNLSRYALSVWIILISSFLILYRGNLVLSETFFAVSLSALAWIVLPILLQWEVYTKNKIFLAGIFCSISFWTQPLSIFLFIIPLLVIKSSKERLVWMAIFSLINLIPILFFLANNQLASFIEQTLWYNFSVYSKLYPTESTSLQKAIQHLQVFFTNEFRLFTRIYPLYSLIQFLFHAAVYVFFIRSVIKREYIVGIVVALFFVTSRVRELKITAGETFNYGIFPFLLFGSVILISVLFQYLGKNKIVLAGTIVTIYCLSFYSLLPVLKESVHNDVNYHIYWSDKQRKGELIRKLTQPNESILIYTNDVDIYYFAQRYPADRFLYWYPWTYAVEEYRKEKTASIKSRKPSVLYLGHHDPTLNMTKYMDVLPFIKERYIKIPSSFGHEGIWIRNDLVKRLDGI